MPRRRGRFLRLGRDIAATWATVCTHSWKSCSTMPPRDRRYASIQLLYIDRSKTAVACAVAKSQNSIPKHRLFSHAGKRVQFDDETWGAVDLLTRDRKMSFQQVATGREEEQKEVQGCPRHHCARP